MKRGDCISCSLVTGCMETSEERLLNDYTCPSYQPVPEAEYLARISMMKTYGEQQAARAILNRPPILTEEQGKT